MTINSTLAGWACGLALTEVPDRVVALARTQVLSQLGSIRAGLAHPFGLRIVEAFGSPVHSDPRAAAYVMAALSVGLDFDDTSFAGHLSHSTVSVPLAYAGRLDLSGRDLLTSVIAANECAARITAAAALGPFRSQSAAHTHLVGSVAGRLRAESAPASIWISALGLALSLPLWPLDRGFFGSDAKLLVAAAPVRLGLDACDAAQHGLVGAVDILEHPGGFLARYADVPLPNVVTAGLGELWHTETLSFKANPGSVYIGAAIACAADLHEQFVQSDPVEIIEVVVEGPRFTVLLDQLGSSFVDGPDSPLPALNFSLGYSTATALLTGGLGPADFTAPALEDPARWDLALKVRVMYSPPLGRAAMVATTPVGEAFRWAGEQAFDWVRIRAGDTAAALLSELGPPARTFETATNRIGARVIVRFADGREIVAARDQAPGSVGSGRAGDQHRLVREKFAATGGDPWVADAVEELESLSTGQLTEVVRRALDQ